jgi:alpha,alpha-trehalose phosphorylase
MIRRKVRLPPDYVYPADDWKLIEKRFYPRLLNGYLGMRGNFEERRPAFQRGTFVNGFHETWPIVYGEEAYGFAKKGQTILNVTDSKIIRLYVDDEPFYLPTANLLRFKRVLDMKAGTLDREVLWETPSGKQISIRSRRLVSFQHRHLAAISYQVTVLNAKAPVVISSEMITEQSAQTTGSDPRRARGFEHRILLPQVSYANDKRIVLSYATNNSKMTLACGIEHVIETACEFSYRNQCSDDIDAQPDKPFHLTKYMTYHTSRSAPPEELCERAERTLDRAVSQGFEQLLGGQQEYLNDFWRRSDVEFQGAHPKGQQLMRWNLFQIIQAVGRAGCPPERPAADALELVPNHSGSWPCGGRRHSRQGSHRPGLRRPLLLGH